MAQELGGQRPAIGRRPRFIDLFAGAGLFGLGFSLEGFENIASYEFDASAAVANALNSGGNVRVEDLSKLRPQGRAEIIIAGPPCQGFSSIGRRNEDDPRNSLCMIIPQWAKVTKARIAVVENVPQFLKSTGWNAMKNEFEAQGFETSTWMVNARDFGVAQNRVRSVTIFSKIGTPDLFAQRSNEETTVADAFKNLPKYPHERIQHVSRPQSPLALERIRRIPPAGDIRDIYRTAPWLVPKSWIKVRTKIVDIWGRLSWGGVSNTIRTGFLNPSRGRFLHPEDDRPISFREAARLQSIPDNFIFDGYAEHMARQIGNAVPVKLSRAIARAVNQII